MVSTESERDDTHGRDEVCPSCKVSGDCKNLPEAERRLPEFVGSGTYTRTDLSGGIDAFVDRVRAERDEALGLLKELADWADLAYRGVARPDGAEVIADALALVERTSQGEAGSGHGSAAEALEDET